MKLKIEIETKTFVRFWLVIAGLALAFITIVAAQQALIILGTAAFLAIALNKPVGFLASVLPGKSRVGGTAIAYVLVLAFIGLFVSFVVPPVIEQTSKVAESVPTFVDQAQHQWKGLNELVDKYGLRDQVNNAVQSVKDNAAGFAASISTNIVSSVGSIFGFLTALFLTLVLSFLMLIEGPRWLKSIWNIYNDEERMEHHKEVTHKIYNVVTGYVTGQLAVSGTGAFFTALTVFIISWIFDVPHNLALPAAAITFILSLIPMFGATIAGVLIFLLLAFNDITAAAIFVVYFIIYQQIENNFISPAIQSKTVELSALAVLASVTVGLYLFGIAGGIISIPIAGSIKVLLEDYLDRAKRRRKKSERPLHKLVKALKEEA